MPPTQKPRRDETQEQRLDRIEAARLKRAANRDLLKARLWGEGASDLAQMLDKCGEPVRLVCCNCGCKKLAEARCKKRWCPSCAYYIAAERVAKYRAAAERFQWPLFVTLTMRNTIDVDGLKKVKKAWASMRRRKLITSKVKSGIVGFEITNKGNGWHPHIHALLDCEWLSLKTPPPVRTDSRDKKALKCRAAAEELSALWAKCVGQEAASVHIRRGDAQALVEVLKYSVKGSDLIECHDRAEDLIRVMQGMRLITTFGEIRKQMKDQDPEEEDDGHKGAACEQCGATGTLIPQDIHDHALRRAFDTRNKIR